MNFYPQLEKSYLASRSLPLWLIANSGLLFLAITFLLGWQLWYESFFTLLKSTLRHTAVSGETAQVLITQSYVIGKSIFLISPLFLLCWRASVPLTLARLNNLAHHKPWWHIFVFDLTKMLLIAILVWAIISSLKSGQWLLTLLVILLFIAGFSFLRYSQTIYFSSEHNHFFRAIGRSWLQHISHVLFLHSLDTLLSLIGFCFLGLVIASFTYLPFLVAVSILLILLYIFGRLSLIWKGLWSYGAYAIMTDHISVS
ncbi:MAG: hypothetical protein HY817_00265 [Candidatus Abawacabacteria bacterium]|nr:hypothetical protein [Candidatus Abawacabacteria bacterium]